MPSRLLKSHVLLYLLGVQLVPWQEEKARYGTNPFFYRKLYLTEKGEKRPLSKALLTKMLAAAANIFEDKKFGLSFSMLLSVYEVVSLSLCYQDYIKTHNTLWIWLNIVI